MRSTAFQSILMTIGLGCGGGDHETETPPEAPTQQVPEAPAAPAGPRVDAPSFTLEATPAATGYTAGQAGTVAIALTPKEGWHMNLDFPTEVEFTASPELAYAKPRLARPDAAAFTEQSVRFDAALTPNGAGARTVDAVVRFAMCNPETCLPQEAHLALPIEVR